jgi:hypothetical protein
MDSTDLQDFFVDVSESGEIVLPREVLDSLGVAGDGFIEISI